LSTSAELANPLASSAPRGSAGTLVLGAVACDGRSPSGLNRYTTSMVSELLRRGGDKTVYVSATPPAEWPEDRLRRCAARATSNFVGNLSRLLWHNLALPRRLRREKAAAFYSPVPEGMLRPVVPQVITVHDVLPLLFPDSYPRLRYYARAFGYGRPTGIDTGDEVSGVIPDPEWKRETRSDPIFNPEDREWYYADTCFTGIGQFDVTATPLQVTRATAAIANGGRLVVPRTTWEVLSPSGDVIKTFDPEWEDVPVDPEHLHEIREGMIQAIETDDGSGNLARREGLKVAGKTGTAEYRTSDGRDLEHAWFTGYYPHDDPQIAITVFFDVGSGGIKAAPVAGEILEFWEQLQSQPAVRSVDE
jgi:hypothetical protein